MIDEKTSPKKRHLGRGLESLLGPIKSPDGKVRRTARTEPEGMPGTAEHGIMEIPVDAIRANRHQTRMHWDESKLNELARSIEANGIVQPIVVRKAEHGFEIIAGERRFRASKMIGARTVKAYVREASEDQMLEWALVENIHRADLNPVERATAYKTYIDRYEISQTEAAKRLGEDRSVVANHMRILELPSDLRQMLVDGSLTMGHAKAILSLPGDEPRRRLANRAMAGRLSVREIERIARQFLSTEIPEKAKKKTKAPHVVEMEARLTEQLGNRVRIETRKNANQGKLIIEFNSLDEFDSVVAKLGIKYTEDI